MVSILYESMYHLVTFMYGSKSMKIVCIVMTRFFEKNVFEGYLRRLHNKTSSSYTEREEYYANILCKHWVVSFTFYILGSLILKEHNDTSADRYVCTGRYELMEMMAYLYVKIRLTRQILNPIITFINKGCIIMAE